MSKKVTQSGGENKIFWVITRKEVTERTEVHMAVFYLVGRWGGIRFPQSRSLTEFRSNLLPPSSMYHWGISSRIVRNSGNYVKYNMVSYRKEYYLQKCYCHIVLATGWTARGSNHGGGGGGGGRDFPHPSRLALVPTQYPIEWVSRLFPDGKRQDVAFTSHSHLAPRLKEE